MKKVCAALLAALFLCAAPCALAAPSPTATPAAGQNWLDQMMQRDPNMKWLLLTSAALVGLGAILNVVIRKREGK
ncbi:MAG: hypothetical protein PHO66_01355 [Eubacteriales bacterium]|nr:hypothetical protein [Eubacteriales bacterium]